MHSRDSFLPGPVFEMILRVGEFDKPPKGPPVTKAKDHILLLIRDEP